MIRRQVGRDEPLPGSAVALVSSWHGATLAAALAIIGDPELAHRPDIVDGASVRELLGVAVTMAVTSTGPSMVLVAEIADLHDQEVERVLGDADRGHLRFLAVSSPPPASPDTASPRERVLLWSWATAVAAMSGHGSEDDA